MKVLISADMEGATGVTWPEDVRPGAPQWERCRRLFTGDVNAVVAGYVEAGADDALVNEAHSSMRNLLLEDLDPRARLLVGWHKPLGMMQGLDDSIDLVAFVGYHAGAGEVGILSHTVLASELTGVWLNDVPASEGRMNAALAAEVGARVVLVTGDDRACADADSYAPQPTRSRSSRPWTATARSCCHPSALLCYCARRPRPASPRQRTARSRRRPTPMRWSSLAPARPRRRPRFLAWNRSGPAECALRLSACVTPTGASGR
jgi:D-amino peptidase